MPSSLPPPTPTTTRCCWPTRVLRTADDNAVVVSSGLSIADDPALSFRGFFGTLYEQGVMGCVDVVNVHPYLFGPDLPAQLNERSLTDLRAFLSEHEDTMPPLWLTEFGYLVPDWIDEAREADAVSDLLARRGVDFDAAFWFSLYDLSSTDTYGLIDTAGRRRPAFSAFAAAP